MFNKEYFRPEWTLGKYREKANVALYYNLIEGVSYFFEGFSAEVMSSILSTNTNTSITLDRVSIETDIDKESLYHFFEELLSLNLLVTAIPSKDDINNYREQTTRRRIESAQNSDNTYNQFVNIESSSAEMEFMNSTDDVSVVMFELTYSCSEQCIHCYNIGANRNDEEVSYRKMDNELTFSEYKALIDQLIEQGMFRVILSGGDPFSYPDVWKIIDYLHKKEIAFDIFTNGINLLSKVDKLSKYYPRSVAVSLYSGVEEVHDLITRVKGSWKKTMGVIDLLSQHSIPFNIKCSVMMPNVKSYYTVLDIAKKYGSIGQLDVCLTDSIEGDRCVSENLRLTPEVLELVLRDKNISLYVGSDKEDFGGIKRNLEYNACGAGYDSFCVTPDGNFIACCAFHEIFGNVRDNDIEDILSSEPIKKWRGLKLKEYDDCGKHDYCDFCNLCVGNNLIEHGNILKCSENNKYIAEIRYELSRKLLSGNDPLNGRTLRECLSDLPEYKERDLKRII